MNTMHALAAPKLGSIDNLRFMELPVPEPARGQVRVRVHCSALNPSELKVLSGGMVGRFLHSRQLPLVAGYDVAGVVDALGAGVSDLAVGDRVWGHLQFNPKTVDGAFCQRTLMTADAVAKLPDSVDFATAAASATSGLTALQALRDRGGLQGGRVLIVGASGGVGSLAVPIAKRLGAEVVAVANARTLDLVRGLGADVVIDRNAQDPFAVNAGDAGYDVVFDASGVYAYGAVAAILGPKGVFVTTLPSLGVFIGKLRTLGSSRRAEFVTVVCNRADLELLGSWLVQGLPVAIERRVPIRDAVAAIHDLAKGGRAGRVVIDVDGGW